MDEKAKIKVVGTNSAYNVKINGVVELKTTFDASQLSGMLKLLAMLGSNFKVGAKLEEKYQNLGEFSIWSVKIDRDGEVSLQLRSDIESINQENLIKLYEEQELVNFLFVG